MASVAAKELANLGVRARVSPYLASEDLAGQPIKKVIRTPKTQTRRPRTRSLALGSSRSATGSPATLSSRDRRAKTRQSREKSPVIDLTTDVDFEVLEANGESPLKNATKPRKDLPTRISHGFSGDHKSAGLNDIPNPNLHHHASPANELNLSPIKKDSPTQPYKVPQESLPRKLPVVQLFLSSPSKRRKMVAFSDNIVSDAPSSPLLGGNEPHMTPRRSILKPASENVDSSPVDPNNSTMWVKTSHSILHQFSTTSHAPNNPEFWQPGTIIQLECKSSDLLQLVDGCVEVLRVEGFCRKFEVYATLNQIFKLNDAVVLSDLFSGDATTSNWVAMIEKTTGFKRKRLTLYIHDICECVTRDIQAIEEKIFTTDGNPRLSLPRNDPFKARTLSQALKLVSSLLMIPSLNSCIPVATVKWFYSHTCEMITKPSISKSLVLPYLSIIKDCHFSGKKRRFIFENNPNPLLERMLFALLNIRNFVSSSLVNEKFIALKNLIQKFPAIMAKNFHLWFGGLVLNLCDITFPLYTKIVSMGITALLEAARNFLDNPDVCLAARKMLEMPLPTEQKSFASENLISISTMPLTVTIDYVSDNLKELIDNGHYKYAMDIWVGLTLLIGNFDNGIENWKHLHPWLQVHKYCFNSQSIFAKITALASWKAIIYKVCVMEFKDNRHVLGYPEGSKGSGELNNIHTTPNAKQQLKLEEVLRPKIKLLIHIFINISSVEFQREIIDTLDHSFLSILYTILNNQQKSNAKMLVIYWDKIIQPVLMNFYFKKEISNSHMHHLGVGIFNRLLKPSTPVNEKTYSTIRCLSHEQVSLGEINSLNPRWIYLRFEKFLLILLVIFKLHDLDIDAKIGSFNNFLNTLKFTTKKELQPSDTTYDIIDNLPMALQILFDNSKASYDSIFKLLVNLNDTFGASNLVSDTDDSPCVFDVILSSTIQSLQAQQLNAILSMLHGAVSERKSLFFLSRLIQTNKKFNREDLAQFVGDSLNSKRSLKFSHQDMILVGKIFKLLDQNFAGIAKKLIQHIVLLKVSDFEKTVEELGLASWNIQIFKFFLTLMHDAPYEHLKLTCLTLIKSKWQSAEAFGEIFQFLIENKFDYEIHSLRASIVDNLQKEEGAQYLGIWEEYLAQFQGETMKLDELMSCSIALSIDLTAIPNFQWKNFPLYQEVFEKKFGSLPKGSKLEENVQTGVTLDAKQVELDNIIQSEFKHDSALTENISQSTDMEKEELEQYSPKDNITIVLSSEPELKDSGEIDAVEKEVKSKVKENGGGHTKENKVEKPPPVRRSERLQSSAAKQLSRKERGNKRQTTANNGEVTKSISRVASKITSDDNTEEIESGLSLEHEEPEYIEDSLGKEETRKRRAGNTEKPSSKKQKIEEDTKQISDSDESVKNKTLPENVNGLMEIHSSSSNSKKSDADSAGSVESTGDESRDGSIIIHTSNSENEMSGDKMSADKVSGEKIVVNLSTDDSFDNSSKIEVNTSNMELVKNSPAKRQLSTVKEVPGMEASSSEITNQIVPAVETRGFLQLKAALEKVDQSEVATLTFQEKYDLETMMMQFILRMRSQGNGYNK
ncbi:CIC11C00000005004 [Sungouiella intermedia]|uniref:CIC11C00000005004 n=1 Tax=Sungouiella intermedia TaxID=45354 RepID=A0A1L0D0N0_9ASCO|nr:CIC11C00000005004 [[Candida] intermedia]